MDSNWPSAPDILSQVQRLQKEEQKVYAVLDPRSSKFLSHWDGVMGLALVFTALVTPFEVSFLPPSSSAVSALFLINRLLDGLFIFDMVLQFNIAYFDEAEQQWVKRRKQLALHYLRTWFTIDIASILPSSADIVTVVQGEKQKNVTSLFRIIRVVRLLKLLRLLRSSRIVARIFARFPIPHKTMVMLKLSVLVIVAAHWSACILSISTIFSSQGRLDTWLASYGYCWPVQTDWNHPDAVFVDNVVEHRWVLANKSYESAQGLTAVMPICSSPIEVYLGAFEWGVLLVSGMDVEPAMGERPPILAKSQRLQRHEVAIRTVVIVAGALIWCYVMAMFIEVVVNTDPNAVSLRNQVSDLNKFIALHRVPRDMALRLREYLYKTKHVMDANSRRNVLHALSGELRADVTILANTSWMQQVPYFALSRADTQQLSPGRKAFLSAIALALEGAVYAPAEWIRGGKIYIVNRGIAFYDNVLCGKGRIWGYRDITYSEWLVHKQARALSYLEVFQVDCTTVRALAEKYDHETLARIRWLRAREALRSFLLFNLYAAQGKDGLQTSKPRKNSIFSAKLCNGQAYGAALETEDPFALHRKDKVDTSELTGLDRHVSDETDRPAVATVPASDAAVSHSCEIGDLRERLLKEMHALRSELRHEMDETRLGWQAMQSNLQQTMQEVRASLAFHNSNEADERYRESSLQA